MRPPPPRPPALRIDSSGSDDSLVAPPPISVVKSRTRPESPGTPIFHQFSTAHANSSSTSLQQNFSRPTGSVPRIPAAATPSSPLFRNDARKHSAMQGMFDSTMPSTAHSNLSQVSANNGAAPLSASQIAAQAAVMSHQNTSKSHVRQRSQTVPFPGDSTDGTRRGSGNKVPLSPPVLSLTEASAPKESAFGGNHSYYDKTAGTHSSAATAAANVVFPRSGHSSPREKSVSPQPFPPVPPIPTTLPDKPSSKPEKSKHKLFSRPSKIGTSKEPKEKGLPSPGKIGSALSALQRGNFSTSSLVDTQTNQSLYNMSNSSNATIRPIESFAEEKVKEKEKKHHFLSRQKQKLKDEYHLPLSSASSNSKPTHPSAPNSLYNFSVPAVPGPGASSAFSKVKKDKKGGDRSDSRLDNESTLSFAGDWIAGSGLPLSQQTTLYDPTDSGKGAPSNLSFDDAWPFLKAKLMVVFEGEDLRLPVEDINRVVQTHIQWCIHKRSPNSMLEDMRDLLTTGFSVLDRTLKLTSEELFIPTLVELWMFTFTSILPYMQSVFLPLELEVSGCGAILTSDQARDFWSSIGVPPPASNLAVANQANKLSDVRRLVLTSYRDVVILPRYETLKTIFSRLSLEFLPSSYANMALASPPLEPAQSSPGESQSPMARPGTAMSLDPSSFGSYNSNSTTLLGEGSERGRSRAVSNVSFGSHGSDGTGGMRPYTPSNLPALSSVREQNVEDSKQVTDMVGRMLQCMSVLSSLGSQSDADSDGSKKIEELCKMLKLNWLGRGRTGRNRRGIVGGRVRREATREELRVV